MEPTGVYRVSGPHPAGDAPIIPMRAWGQGARGAAGYEDAGESELFFRPVNPEKCRDIMTKDSVCCLRMDSAERAARLMKQLDIGIVPVVGNRKSKKLIGVVTNRDLIRRVPVTHDSGRIVGVIAQSGIALRLRDTQKTGEVTESLSQPDPARV